MEKFKPAKQGNLERNPSFSIDKSQVLLEARQCFMATAVKSKKLIDILTRCIIILFQDEQKLTRNEATDLFFHVTRLFQYKGKEDSTLRRLTYIAIKALSQQQAENIYVVTSSLTNDFNPISDPAIRASALRALCRISDLSTLPSIEPYIKQAIVDKHPIVASAALTSITQMLLISKSDGSTGCQQIKSKFQQQVKDSFELGTPTVQYHALGLWYLLCEHDKESLTHLIYHCILKQTLGSPRTYCLFIRILTSYLNANNSQQQQQLENGHVDDGTAKSSTCLSYIKNQLDSNPDQMVEFEAASCLINLKFISTESVEHKSAVAHLRNFLTSDKLSLRFSSVRLLNELVNTTNGQSQSIRFWSVHRIGGLCKLHLLNKHYRIGDHIIGLLDFTDANLTCAKYTVILQCEESHQYELKEEFSLGLKRSDIMITIPNLVNPDNKSEVLHCVLSFLFYIADQGHYSKTLFKDKAGTIELGPGELDTKLFSCDFPIAIHR